MLVSIEIAQLHMRFGHCWIERYYLLQQRLDLAQVEAGVFCPLTLPQTHRVIVNCQRIVGLQFRKTAKALDYVVRLIGRALIGLG